MLSSMLFDKKLINTPAVARSVVLLVRATFIVFVLTGFGIAQTFVETGRFGGSGTERGLLNEPAAIDIAPDGTVYVVDTGNNRVQLFSPEGVLIESVGGFGFEPDQFDRPLDIWARSIINIFVSDYNNRRLVRYDRNMNFLNTLTSNEGSDPDYQFEEVLSCAVNRQNELFLLDHGENKIIKFDRRGNAERAFGFYEAGSGELKQPVQLDILPENRLVVSDIGRNGLLIFDFFGNFLFELKLPGSKAPSGLAVSKAGRLFVTDQVIRQIYIISEDLKEIKRIKYFFNQVRDVAVRIKPDQGDKKIILYVISGDEILTGNLIE